LNDLRTQPLGEVGWRQVGWRQIVDRMRRASRRHQASVLAGGVAFYSFLSIWPALAALVSIYGLVANPQEITRQVDAVFGALPPDARAAVLEQVTSLVARSPGTLSLEATISIIAAVWAATKGMKALITGLSLAFGQPETRGFIRLSATAFGFTLASIVAGVVGIAAVIVLPMVMSFFHLSRFHAGLIRWLRWPTLCVLVLLGLSAAYRFGPARPPPWRRWLTPGSVAAAALWLAGSAIFSWVASMTTKTDRFDGSVGVVITILTWFLLSAYVVILGAELDAEIARAAAAPPASEEPPVTPGA
jgi:membrane protein